MLDEPANAMARASDGAALTGVPGSEQEEAGLRAAPASTESLLIVRSYVGGRDDSELVFLMASSISLVIHECWMERLSESPASIDDALIATELPTPAPPRGEPGVVGIVGPSENGSFVVAVGVI